MYTWLLELTGLKVKVFWAEVHMYSFLKQKRGKINIVNVGNHCTHGNKKKEQPDYSVIYGHPNE